MFLSAGPPPPPSISDYPSPPLPMQPAVVQTVTSSPPFIPQQANSGKQLLYTKSRRQGFEDPVLLGRKPISHYFSNALVSNYFRLK